jgi:hypothetical protein
MKKALRRFAMESLKYATWILPYLAAWIVARLQTR